jgi:hypothetical protein
MSGATRSRRVSFGFYSTDEKNPARYKPKTLVAANPEKPL